MTLGMLTSSRGDAAASVHGNPPVRANGRRAVPNTPSKASTKRCAALRVAPRQEQCARHDGSAAGREYAAVLLVLSRLPKHARPVPPIYRPEFGARGILYAADHPYRREYWVGASTMATLPANANVPGLLDRYPRPDRRQVPTDQALARTGCPSEPVGAGRRAGRARLRRARGLRHHGPHP